MSGFPLSLQRLSYFGTTETQWIVFTGASRQTYGSFSKLRASGSQLLLIQARALRNFWRAGQHGKGVPIRKIWCEAKVPRCKRSFARRTKQEVFDLAPLRFGQEIPLRLQNESMSARKLWGGGE